MALSQCPYCKNPDIERVVSKVELSRHIEYYGHHRFAVFRCFCCNATWHHETGESGDGVFRRIVGFVMRAVRKLTRILRR